MIRFIHTADLHIGMENYGRIDQNTGIHTRLLDFEKVLSFCVDHALSHDVDAFLLAGDAYKTAHPTPTHQRILFNQLMRLYKADIPVVMVVGNHDHPLSFGKTNTLDLFGALPVDGFHVFSKPGNQTIITKRGPLQITGIPWPTRHTLSLHNQQTSAADISAAISRGVGTIISQLAAELNPLVPAVLLAHLTVGSGLFSGSEKRAIYGSDPVLLPSQLALKPYDYVALGHLHRYQNLNMQGQPPIIYAGSLERIDFGERREEKGFCVVDIISKKETAVKFVATPTRPFIQIEVYLTDQSNHTEQIIQELNNHNLTDAIIKIIYHVPGGIKDSVDHHTLQVACAHAFLVISVIAIRTPELKERRTILKADMDLSTLLNAYLSNKQLDPVKKQELISKTLILMAELQEDHVSAR